MPPITKDQLGFSNMIIKSKMTLRNRLDMTSLGEKKERIKRVRNLSMLDQYDESASGGQTSKMVDQES
jgi:hypothetical protein